MPTYKLTYFNMKGRAEVSRMLFALSDTPYEDIRLTEEEFAKIKPQTPFGKLPILEIDGKVYAQSVGQYIYLAKEFGYYGQTNIECLKIDEVVHQMTDFLADAIKSLMEKDDAKREELTKKFYESDCPMYFGYYEKLLQQNGTGYFVGNKLTLADIIVYEFADGLNLEKPGQYAQFPAVTALVEKVGSIDRIKKHVATRPVTRF